ncbi:hypothetical protein PTI98_002014 [Pleurotus ostreatus]|nr:hypothetical protein PTI98_002014 [Pleurotus ostreatus]
MCPDFALSVPILGESVLYKYTLKVFYLLTLIQLCYQAEVCCATPCRFLYADLTHLIPLLRDKNMYQLSQLDQASNLQLHVKLKNWRKLVIASPCLPPSFKPNLMVIINGFLSSNK